MKLNSGTAADVLKTFIQEDRIESRIYRSRVQSVSYTLAVASFATSAFLIGKVPRMNADQLRNITLVIDLGLIVVMLIFLWRLRPDLVLLRKAMKARQDILDGLDEETVKDVNVFPNVENVKPDITDNDLYSDVALSVAVVLTKMLVITIYAGSFVG
ncbi:MAG TPA: hypothetical protein VIW95_06930 [Candidatus Binatus sp.]|jgi:hypothetical protein|uniref:hypothetical protein n=1 Tax=Candidatus Binatus sp. TaxID=2811406 RepID=UPI002F40B6A3